MKVGIDITSLAYDRGVSRYTSNLVTALLSYTQTQLWLYGSSLRKKKKILKELEQLNIPDSRITLQSYPPSMLSYLWRVGLNPIQKKLPKIEVFHSWDWLQPPDKSLPLVSSIHDLAILKYPETAHPKVLKMHQQSWKVLKQRRAHIIAVSHATKKDIVELLNIPKQRIHVIPEALPVEIETASKNMSEERYQSVSRHLPLARPFILFVGTREPRKNLKRLIEAWKPLAKEVRLVIAGEPGWDETGKSLKANEDLKFLGKVSTQQLSVLYNEAKMLAFPSLYEGFGLPILEAFYHGTPVVTSDTSSMPEVAGNAAELVNPESVTSIRKGLETILNESETQHKKRLQKMIIRLHLFSWSRVAKETVDVYKKAIDSNT